MYHMYDTFSEFIGEFRKRSPSTVLHMENVASHAYYFVQRLQIHHELALKFDADGAWRAGLYHDLGKSNMVDIINSSHKLTQHEYDVIKNHPAYSLTILKHYNIKSQHILDAAYYHHVDFTGDNGYPNDICGKEIPKIARIISIIDVYEALYSKRPYKSNLPYENVKQIMSDKMRYKFDPDIFELFFRYMDEKILI